MKLKGRFIVIQIDGDGDIATTLDNDGDQTATFKKENKAIDFAKECAGKYPECAFGVVEVKELWRAKIAGIEKV